MIFSLKIIGALIWNKPWHFVGYECKWLQSSNGQKLATHQPPPHPVTLQAVIQPSLQNITLPKLETLKLYTRRDEFYLGTGPSIVLEYYIRTCGATLKNLQLYGIMYLGEESLSPSTLPRMQSLTLDVTFEARVYIFKLFLIEKM